MPKVAKSKRVKHVKSHKKALAKITKSKVEHSDDAQSHCSDSSDTVFSESSASSVSCATPANLCASLALDHSYARGFDDCSVILEPEPIEPAKVEMDVLLDARLKLLHMLPNYCTPVVTDDTQVSVIFLSRQSQLSITRSIQFHVNGEVTVNVHCKTVASEPFLKDAPPPMPLQDLDGVGYFVDRALAIVNSLRLKEVCAGVDNDNYCPAWEYCTQVGTVDVNPYKECRYTETFRSYECELLVDSNKWRCSKCSSVTKTLRRKTESINQAERSSKTANIHLTPEEMLDKLKGQRRVINAKNEAMRRLRKKMEVLIETEGKKIDKDLASDFTAVLRDAKLTPAQHMFMQQQVKVSMLNNKCSMKWHPSIIRLALSIFETSRSAYERLRDSGFISLPSSRTLFDYTHFSSVSLGIDNVVVKSVSDRVDSMPKKKKYHVLMADEMYISKNLVYKKATGELVGYTNLDSIDKDLKLLEDFFQDTTSTDTNNSKKKVEEEVANKVLCYLVKGVANDVKEVVAIFATKSVSPKQMYMWTWQVISALERGGVRIIAFVGDGCSVNRAFVKMHTPAHPLRKSGVVYCTVNKAAPDRLLFFISDVPHLLKTLRNSFYTSRLGKKGKRCMIKNHQKIVWDHIMKLFNAKKSDVLRKSYKLTAQHVHPDSYSCMKVPLAAQVMSKTVGTDLESQNWEGTNETVNFILKVNNWFDCLNGAHTAMGKKKRNERLMAYTKVDDWRFKELEEFLEYLEEWQQDAQAAPLDISGVANLSQCADDPAEINHLEEDEDENDTPTSKRLPAGQTILGIEMSTLAIIGAVKFLLNQQIGAGLDFVNARVFCQDPIEHYFSKMRAGFGGSTNPNVDAFIHKARTSHVVGQVGIKRKGNSSEVCVDEINLSDMPLQKRKYVRK